MGIVEIVTLTTAVIPFVTKLAKNLFKTEKIKEPYRKGVNALLPIAIGIASSGIFAFSQGQDIWSSLAIGLGSGGAASSVRDVEKNLVRLIEGISKLFLAK